MKLSVTSVSLILTIFLHFLQIGYSFPLDPLLAVVDSPSSDSTLLSGTMNAGGASFTPPLSKPGSIVKRQKRKSPWKKVSAFKRNRFS